MSATHLWENRVRYSTAHHIRKKEPDVDDRYDSTGVLKRRIKRTYCADPSNRANGWLTPGQTSTRTIELFSFLEPQEKKLNHYLLRIPVIVFNRGTRRQSKNDITQQSTRIHQAPTIRTITEAAPLMSEWTAAWFSSLAISFESEEINYSVSIYETSCCNQSLFHVFTSVLVTRNYSSRFDLCEHIFSLLELFLMFLFPLNLVVNEMYFVLFVFSGCCDLLF